ncbi:hypothetical protein DDP54_04780 [Cellulomonas sp. WB94]|uniref:hypothetical protein n=1 Tax=Cellulomonas sp. WB94 TaxID=2173174 RepID=UPI000D5666E4|nr:hypothetical protein [Cellulomonas sp. WB94]PVU82432.1 hypothetical protein DDP54_04780 [Cellulomonas sp. WB94]
MSQTRSIVAGGIAAVVLLGFGTWMLFADPSRMSELGGPLVVTNATETDPPPSASPAATTEPTPPDALAMTPARQVARPAAAVAPSASSGGDVRALTATSAASPSADGTATSSAPRANGKPANDSAKTPPGAGRADAAIPSPTTTSGTSTSNVDATPGWFTVSPPWAHR